MIEVKRYNKNDKRVWDDFCKTSLNGTFLFYRDYMDYHSDRYCDHSLLFYKDNKLVALLPCNERAEKLSDNISFIKILSSHDGLTFGSFIMGTHTHQSDMLECVDALIVYCKVEGISEVRFKPIPVLFQSYPSEQDIYALIKNGAELLQSEPSTVTNIKRYCPSYGEKRFCRTALKESLSCRYCEEDLYWDEFHGLLTQVLKDYHGVNPVHNISELLLLHHRFPENMRLFAVFNSDDMLAGTIIYEYNNAIHTQYMASNEEGRNNGALHFCIQNIINYYSDKEWLDFGISTENKGKVLNSGLIRFKEGFKGNTMLYNKWSLKINNDEN